MFLLGKMRKDCEHSAKKGSPGGLWASSKVHGQKQHEAEWQQNVSSIFSSKFNMTPAHKGWRIFFNSAIQMPS